MSTAEDLFKSWTNALFGGRLVIPDANAFKNTLGDDDCFLLACAIDDPGKIFERMLYPLQGLEGYVHDHADVMLLRRKKIYDLYKKHREGDEPVDDWKMTVVGEVKVQDATDGAPKLPVFLRLIINEFTPLRTDSVEPSPVDFKSEIETIYNIVYDHHVVKEILDDIITAVSDGKTADVDMSGAVGAVGDPVARLLTPPNVDWGKDIDIGGAEPEMTRSALRSTLLSTRVFDLATDNDVTMEQAYYRHLLLCEKLPVGGETKTQRIVINNVGIVKQEEHPLWVPFTYLMKRVSHTIADLASVVEIHIEGFLYDLEPFYAMDRRALNNVTYVMNRGLLNRSEVVTDIKYHDRMLNFVHKMREKYERYDDSKARRLDDLQVNERRRAVLRHMYTEFPMLSHVLNEFANQGKRFKWSVLAPENLFEGRTRKKRSGIVRRFEAGLVRGTYRVSFNHLREERRIRNLHDTNTNRRSIHSNLNLDRHLKMFIATTLSMETMLKIRIDPGAYAMRLPYYIHDGELCTDKTSYGYTLDHMLYKKNRRGRLLTQDIMPIDPDLKYQHMFFLENRQIIGAGSLDTLISDADAPQLKHNKRVYQNFDKRKIPLDELVEKLKLPEYDFVHQGAAAECIFMNATKTDQKRLIEGKMEKFKFKDELPTEEDPDFRYAMALFFHMANAVDDKDPSVSLSKILRRDNSTLAGEYKDLQRNNSTLAREYKAARKSARDAKAAAAARAAKAAAAAVTDTDEVAELSKDYFDKKEKEATKAEAYAESNQKLIQKALELFDSSSTVDAIEEELRRRQVILSCFPTMTGEELDALRTEQDLTGSLRIYFKSENDLKQFKNAKPTDPSQYKIGVRETGAPKYQDDQGKFRPYKIFISPTHEAAIAKKEEDKVYYENIVEQFKTNNTMKNHRKAISVAMHRRIIDGIKRNLQFHGAWMDSRELAYRIKQANRQAKSEHGEEAYRFYTAEKFPLRRDTDPTVDNDEESSKRNVEIRGNLSRLSPDVALYMGLERNGNNFYQFRLRKGLILTKAQKRAQRAAKQAARDAAFGDNYASGNMGFFDDDRLSSDDDEDEDEEEDDDDDADDLIGPRPKIAPHDSEFSDDEVSDNDDDSDSGSDSGSDIDPYASI